MATRLYLSNGTAPVTPSGWTTGWNVGGTTLTRYATTGKWTDAASGNNTGDSGTGTSGTFRPLARFVSDPLLTSQSIAGTIKGVVRCNEANAADNYTLAIAVQVIQADGSNRGTLLSPAASDDTSATPPEMAVGTNTNRRFRDSSESASITLTNVDAQAGDMLVIEVGFRQASTSTAQCTINYGSRWVTADCAEDDTSTDTSTTATWVEFSQDIVLVPTFRSYFSTPLDNGTNTADPTAVSLDQPTLIGAVAGDLVLMYGHQRATGATPAVSVTGGQTWTSETVLTGTLVSPRLFWCVFDGTWTANPSVDFSAAVCNSVYALVFRPPKPDYTWAVNVAQAETDDATGPFTHAGQTTTGSAPTVSVAAWFSADDNTWGTLSGTGWVKPSQTPQVRNTSGSDQSATFAWKIKTSAGATGSVEQSQLTLGDDAAVISMISFSSTAPAATTDTVGTLTGAGAASAVGQTLHGRAGAATGAGAAAAASIATIARAASATGAGAAAGVGAATASVTGAATGTGTAAGVGVALYERAGSAAGAGAAAAVGETVAGATEIVGSATGAGAAAAAGIAITAVVGSATGAGTASAVGAATAAAVATATGTGTASGIGAATAASAGSATGTGTATAVGTGINARVGSAAGTGAASAVGTATTAAAGSAAGTGTATALSIAITARNGAASGTGTATAVGAATAASTGSASGTGAAAAVGTATAASIGSAAGTGTAAAQSAAGTTVGAASGTGAAAAVGQTIRDVVGSATGTGTAAAVSEAVGSVGSASGTGAASGVILSLRDMIGAATGTGAASAVSQSASESVGSATGTGTASALGTSVVSTVGEAWGAGEALARGAATIETVGTAAGTGAATGILFVNIAQAIGTAVGTGAANAASERAPPVFYDFPIGRRLAADYGIRGSKLGIGRRRVIGRR